MRENQDTLGIFVNHMISEIKDEDESEEDDFKDQPPHAGCYEESRLIDFSHDEHLDLCAIGR